MTSKWRDAHQPPLWLVEWLEKASRHTQGHSLVLGAGGRAMHHVADELAEYLNEFDDQAESSWRVFDADLICQLADHSVCRDLILGRRPPTAIDRLRPEPEQIARKLIRMGAVILLGRSEAQATSDLDTNFQVSLCPKEPPATCEYHMWVNPRRLPSSSLVSVIADSFLDWSSHDQRCEQSPSRLTSSRPIRVNPPRH